MSSGPASYQGSGRTMYLEIALALFAHAPGGSSASEVFEYGNLYVGIEYEDHLARWNIGEAEAPYVSLDTWASALALWLREWNPPIAGDNIISEQ